MAATVVSITTAHGKKVLRTAANNVASRITPCPLKHTKPFRRMTRKEGEELFRDLAGKHITVNIKTTKRHFD